MYECVLLLVAVLEKIGVDDCVWTSNVAVPGKVWGMMFPS
jgi:hypothetical protein